MDPLAATFIVRLAPTGSGAWTAVVEQVKTGKKFRVSDIDAIGTLIAEIVAGKCGGEFPPRWTES
ncbi:MAG: hypothetical protein HY017_09930 [Betaproteobacteria bacterium]|nr:hypothetical protein [Betaproteobacteria bacterium]